ncbi:hypothetical protein [Bradyrhizobium macuxiense]|nr:hypothetical protein [Bradyrhizobium macuxiense]
MSEQMHPLAPHHLPFYLAPPSGTDVWMVAMGIFLVATVFYVGVLYWRLHSLPERMAHKSEKLQFEIVAILGLISLFTHIHAFWVAGLLLALIDIPDFGTPLRSIAGSVEKIADASDAGASSTGNSGEAPHQSTAGEPDRNVSDAAKQEVQGHA